MKNDNTDVVHFVLEVKRTIESLKEVFREYYEQNMRLVPLEWVKNYLVGGCQLSEEWFEGALTKARIMNYVELRRAKSKLLKNMGLKAVEIKGIDYGFIKILI